MVRRPPWLLLLLLLLSLLKYHWCTLLLHNVVALLPVQAFRSDVALSLKVVHRDSAAAGRGITALVGVRAEGAEGGPIWRTSLVVDGGGGARVRVCVSAERVQ